MRLFVLAAAAWSVIMAILAIAGWLVRRRGRRQPTLGAPVSPQWLSENVYTREGDDRQAK